MIKELEQGKLTYCVEDTYACAEALAGIIPKDRILTFRGDLGAGKTTFIKGLARAWGIKETITSPTYNFFATYRGTRNLLHLDAYRLEDPNLSEALLLDDFLETPYCLAIEWPEKLGGTIEGDSWHLYLRIAEPGKHEIRLERPSET